MLSFVGPSDMGDVFKSEKGKVGLVNEQESSNWLDDVNISIIDFKCSQGILIHLIMLIKHLDHVDQT